MMTMEKEDLALRLSVALERAAAKIGFEIDKEGLAKTGEYANELQKWNRAYNLVGRKLGTEGLIDLFVDAVTPLSIRGLFDGGKEVVDIGSGAGLPGLPLYMLSGPFPLTLVESQRKKITFLRHIRRKLELEGIKVYPGRLEDLIREEDQLNAYEIGLARAVMDPLRLVRLARPLLCEGGRILVFVGKGDADKIRKASPLLNEKGLQLEALRSTQRFVGKENYLAVIKKTGR